MEIKVNNQIIDYFIKDEKYINLFFNNINTKSKINVTSLDIPKSEKNRNIFGNDTKGIIMFDIFPYTCYYDINGFSDRSLYLLCSIDMIEYNREQKLKQLGI